MPPPSASRRYELVIFLFGVPYYVLMNVKIIGPATFIVAQAGRGGAV